MYFICAGIDFQPPEYAYVWLRLFRRRQKLHHVWRTPGKYCLSVWLIVRPPNVNALLATQRPGIVPRALLLLFSSLGPSIVSECPVQPVRFNETVPMTYDTGGRAMPIPTLTPQIVYYSDQHRKTQRTRLEGIRALAVEHKCVHIASRTYRRYLHCSLQPSLTAVLVSATT